MSRVLNPRHVRVNPDPKGTNLVLRMPFSRKLATPLSESGTTVSTTLADQYATVFPYLTQNAILGARLDRIVVWGTDSTTRGESTTDTPVYLQVGTFYSRSDLGGKNQRAVLGCVPKLEDGQSDETTNVMFRNSASIQVTGVVFVRRESVPTTAETLTTECAPTYSVCGSQASVPIKRLQQLF